MSNTSSNFEMAGVLSGKNVRKRKTPQGKPSGILSKV